MYKDGIPFDGYGSVLEMLRRSDAAFREKIILNLRRKDPNLAARLELNLRRMGIGLNNTSSSTSASAPQENRAAAVERGHRAAASRVYGQR